MGFTDRAAEYIARQKTATHLVCENIAGRMEAKAKSIAPWTDRTSHARQSINSGVELHGDTFIMYVAHGVRYGRYFEKGTAPHVILPRNRQALYWAGAAHPVKKVNHPGSRKYPAIVPAAQAGQQELRIAIQHCWGV